MFAPRTGPSQNLVYVWLMKFCSPYGHYPNGLPHPWIRKASALIAVSSVFDRTEEKYDNRGLRHIYTEYGHCAQNVSLITTELGLGACSIGGFIDDGLNELLDFDKIDESIIGVIAIGTI